MSTTRNATTNLAVACLVAILAACGDPLEVEELAVDRLDEARVAGDVELVVERASTPSVRFEGQFEHAIEDGILTVRAASNGGRVVVRVDKLDRLDVLGKVRLQHDGRFPNEADFRLSVYGDSAVALQELSAHTADIRVAGNGGVTIGEMLADDLTVLGSGTARVVMTGSTETLRVELLGATEVDLGTLRAQTVDVAAAGDARLVAWATAHLSGEIKGATDVVYKGGPDVSVEVVPPAQLRPFD